MRTYKYAYDYLGMSEAICQARKGRGLSQHALAQAIGRSVPTISKMERGKQYPDIGIMICICWLLDINPMVFLHPGGELKKTVSMWETISELEGAIKESREKLDRRFPLVQKGAIGD